MTTNLAANKSTPAASDSSLAALQRDWLLRQARDFYRRSADTWNHKPRSRELNRQKFIDAVQALLPVIGRDTILAAFGGNERFPPNDTAEARAIIIHLADAMSLESSRHWQNGMTEITEPLSPSVSAPGAVQETHPAQPPVAAHAAANVTSLPPSFGRIMVQLIS